MSPKSVPRSAYDPTGGIVYFARMLDKIRLHAANRLREDFQFMLKRGWRDEDDGSTQELEAYKAASGLAHRSDIVTFFDFYEVDEGRKT